MKNWSLSQAGFQYVAINPQAFSDLSKFDNRTHQFENPSDRMRDEDKTSEYEDEWKYAAMVIDRICAFVFFTGLFIVFAVTVCVGAAQN